MPPLRLIGGGKVDAEHPARMSDPLGCCCNIGEMARKVSVKCAIAGCHYQRKMTLAEREELRRVGRENHATAGLVCPAHVRAAFNFEFDDIDIDVPLGGTPGRGVQGNSPLARDAGPAAGGVG